MKNKKIVITVGIAALSAATVVICSCFSEHAPIAATIYSPNEFVQSSENESLDDELINSSDSVPKSPLPSELENSSSGTASNTSTPEKHPRFDDPASYLNYDIETDTYILSEEEEKLGSESLFVGDSICMGFSTWSVVESKNVYATGNVGTHNMLDYEMYYLGEPAKFVPVLNSAKPKHIFLWMGMNDVNLISSEEYCKNYKTIIETALENSEADVYVCAITPMRNLKYTEPAYITEFNDAAKNFIRKNYKERVYFINFAEPLKNADGLLDEQYDGGDGIHLDRKTYYVAMHEINKQVVRE